MSLPSVILEFMPDKKDYSEYKIKKGTKPIDDPYFQFADDFNVDYETAPITLDGQVNPKWVAQFEEE